MTRNRWSISAKNWNVPISWWGILGRQPVTQANPTLLGILSEAVSCTRVLIFQFYLFLIRMKLRSWPVALKSSMRINRTHQQAPCAASKSKTSCLLPRTLKFVWEGLGHPIVSAKLDIVIHCKERMFMGLYFQEKLLMEITEPRSPQKSSLWSLLEQIPPQCLMELVRFKNV